MSCQRAREIDVARFLVDTRAPEWEAFRAHYPACADCTREVESWTQLESALRRAGAGETGTHPSDDDLLAFEDEPVRLSEAQRNAIASHLGGCRLCRNELAVLRRFDFTRIEAPEPSAPWARLRAALQALRHLGERALAPVPKPAVVMAALALLLVLPAALYMWRTLPGASGPGGAGPPIARVEKPERAPEATPNRVEPAPQVEVAAQETPSAPRVPPGPEPEPPQPAVEPPPRLLAKAPAPEPPVPSAESAADDGVAEQAEPEAEPILIASLLPSELPVYKADPALIGAAGMRVTTLVRGEGTVAPELEVAAPDHVGLTGSPSPTLYWHLAEPTELPVEVSVTAPGVARPLLDVSLPGPHAAGFHAVALRERGVDLDPGVTYRWYVSLVVDPVRRSRDLVAGGAIRRAPQSEPPTSEAERAHAYAQAGLWYDAFDQLSRWIGREPGEPRLHRYRAALLDQVGLGSLAEEDRALAEARR